MNCFICYAIPIGFSQDKIPDNLDAIIIGSGIGGLAAAALMAKSNKKVLVLEQHDQVCTVAIVCWSAICGACYWPNLILYVSDIMTSRV